MLQPGIFGKLFPELGGDFIDVNVAGRGSEDICRAKVSWE